MTASIPESLTRSAFNVYVNERTGMWHQDASGYYLVFQKTDEWILRYDLIECHDRNRE
jgi:hypothetical protein